MIVLDASAVVELILDTDRGRAVRERLVEPGEDFSAPHLLDAEVVHVLRRYERAGEIPEKRARAALRDLLALPARRYRHDMLLPRVWELRENTTAYDAIYLALAEALDAPLLTCDRRMQGVPGALARVDVVEPRAPRDDSQT